MQGILIESVPWDISPRCLVQYLRCNYSMAIPGRFRAGGANGERYAVLHFASNSEIQRLLGADMKWPSGRPIVVRPIMHHTRHGSRSQAGPVNVLPEPRVCSRPLNMAHNSSCLCSMSAQIAGVLSYLQAHQPHFDRCSRDPNYSRDWQDRYWRNTEELLWSLSGLECSCRSDGLHSMQHRDVWSCRGRGLSQRRRLIEHNWQCSSSHPCDVDDAGYNSDLPPTSEPYYTGTFKAGVVYSI